MIKDEIIQVIKCLKVIQEQIEFMQPMQADFLEIEIEKLQEVCNDQ
jgi:hypothetical protein